MQVEDYPAVTIKLITGDCRDVLKTLSDESVHCVVTSPPYWGLRDYGVDGQLGLEQSLGEHVQIMVEVFREVRRVLRKDGTLWLNYGDSYAASPNGRSAADTKATGNDDRTFRDKPFSTVGPISRVGKSGNKGNVAGDHGHRVLSGGRLARWDRKSERNGHNLGADDSTVADIRIMHGGYLKPKDLCGIPWRVAFALQEDGWWLRQDIIWSKTNPMPESVRDRCTKAHEYLFLMAKSERYYFDQEAIKEDCMQDEYANGFRGGSYVEGKAEIECGNLVSGEVYVPNGKRNKRSVWEVATAPFSEAHFATFPPALIEPCILAGCPKNGTVLDPFAGAGTTGLVADRLQRNAVLIELNPKYVEIAQRRIGSDAPLFTQVETNALG